MGVVTELKKANGEVLRIIDGAYVVGAGGACEVVDSPCGSITKRVLGGAYLLEECGERAFCLSLSEGVRNGTIFISFDPAHSTYFFYATTYTEISDFESLYVGSYWGDIGSTDTRLFHANISTNGAVYFSQKIYHTTYDKNSTYASTFSQIITLPVDYSRCQLEPNSFGAMWVRDIIKDKTTGKFFYYYNDSSTFKFVRKIEINNNDGIVPFDIM